MRVALVAVALSMLWLGCPAPTASGAAARTAAPVTGVEARSLIASGAWLVDVRTPEEFAQAHLDGARNVPLSDLESALGTLPKDKPVIVYCAVGARSARAAQRLVQAGVDVRNLGAMDNWNR